MLTSVVTYVLVGLLTRPRDCYVTLLSCSEQYPVGSSWVGVDSGVWVLRRILLNHFHLWLVCKASPIPRLCVSSMETGSSCTGIGFGPRLKLQKTLENTRLHETVLLASSKSVCTSNFWSLAVGPHCQAPNEPFCTIKWRKTRQKPGNKVRMEHECAISDMLGDICAADHVVKILQTFPLCSGMTTNWRCTMEGLLVLLVYYYHLLFPRWWSVEILQAGKRTHSKCSKSHC